MTDRVDRLNAALERRCSVEAEIGHGGMATAYPWEAAARTSELRGAGAPQALLRCRIFVVENFFEEIEARVPH
jgi:hypothetical protein